MGAMKTVKLMIALLLVGAVSVDNAWADRRHGGHHRHFNRSFSVVIGAPLWDPFYYPRYYPPYYAPLVIERPVPQVYIERQPSVVVPLAADAGNYWYYCSSAKGYYPYVSECPGGWQKVLPRPPE